MAKYENKKIGLRVKEVDSETLYRLTEKGYQMQLDGDAQVAYFERPEVLC
jgi:hypothetical protein